MKNILHIIESLEFGGAEKVVVQLANCFSHTYNVTICTTKRSGELSSSIKTEVNYVCLNGSEGNDFSIINKIATVIGENEIDIVHIHKIHLYIYDEYKL